MKDKITSVLIFPYNNQLEVRVSRGRGYNQASTKINLYHAKYSDMRRVKRLAKLASKLVELNTVEMIRTSSFVNNPIR